MRTIGAEVKDPKFVEIAHKGTAAETVEQFIIPVAQGQKNELLEYVLDEKGADRVIIFTRTKSRAEVLAERLNREGFSAEAIHGDRSQGQRSRALKNFRDGRVGVLVATDVLARGIDVSDVDHVINYDVPMDPEDYIHRIGRTGRAGEAGFAITFVTRDEVKDLYDIEYLMKKTVEEMELDGFDFDDRRPELDPDRDPTQRPRRGGKGGGRGGRGRGGFDRGERFERGERGGMRGRNIDRSVSARDRHSAGGNRDRVERQEARQERISREEQMLTGGERSERSGYNRDERREARFASRDERYGSNSRGRSFDRDDRGADRGYGRNERSGGGFRDRYERDDRPARRDREGGSSRGSDRGYGSKGGSAPRQYGMQRGSRKPGDRGGDQ